MDALLLGRRTYDIFASYWPHQDSGIAQLFNRIPKYVASRQSLKLEWDGSSQLGPDVVASLRELRGRHENMHVIGSLDFVQTLFAGRLFDRLNLWMYPIILGRGKKVFAGGVVPTSLQFIEPVVASPKGAVMQRYALVEGTPGVGDMTAEEFPDKAMQGAGAQPSAAFPAAMFEAPDTLWRTQEDRGRRFELGLGRHSLRRRGTWQR